jgi:hypothetical protein
MTDNINPCDLCKRIKCNSYHLKCKRYRDFIAPQWQAAVAIWRALVDAEMS